MQIANSLIAILAFFCISAHSLLDREQGNPVEARAPSTTLSPLPIETDGVESNGAVINSQSWIKPSNTPISGTSQNYDYSGPCTIDVTQSGWGIPAQYEAWVRDASNAAIGGLSATMIGATVSFPAGGQDMSIGVVPAPYPNMSAKVVMTWGKAVSMAYNPATSMDSQGCAFAGNTPGSVTYFQCSFDCTPLGKS